MNLKPKILSVGTAVPETRYSQREIIDYFYLNNENVSKFFDHPHIQKRHLTLPPRDPLTKVPTEESTGTLLKKFRSLALEIARMAVEKALARRKLEVPEIDYLCCVNSTGFIVPGLSALVHQQLKFRADCQRADIVGMGCNAGLNGLQVVANWCQAHPERKALLVCVEICSAIYSIDDSPNSMLVNSLFADGAAAAVLSAKSSPASSGTECELVDFASHLIPDSLDKLRFDWDDHKHRYAFWVDRDTPKRLSEQVNLPVGRLLERAGLHTKDIHHWVLHTGGSAILDGIEKKLDLEPSALRHTRSVLRDFGNVSSGSFLFSYERLLHEATPRSGDYGLMATMGPGLTIETALVRF